MCGPCWLRFRTCRRQCWPNGWAERVGRNGWAGRARSGGSARTCGGCVPSSVRSTRPTGISWSPGDAAQCDLWFPPRKIPLEDGTAKLLPVLVITAAHSRFMVGRMIPTRKTEDLLLGSWELIQQLGGVPRRLIWDNESGIGRGQRRAEGVAAFMGMLATRLVLLPPNDPESEGVVERRNGWFETSFMRGRSFASPADFNIQFGDRLTRANARAVRAIKASPLSRLDADRAAMLPLPPVPLHLGWRNKIRLGRDHYVRLDTIDYSVDPNVIGRMVDVAADLERVRIRLEGRIVAEHERVWARGMTVTDPAHGTRAGPMRTTSLRCSNVRCQPATPPVPNCGSAPSDSVG